MKLPAIPVPEPVFMITVTHPSAGNRRVMVTAIRFLLWTVPACALSYFLSVADGHRHSPWMTLLAAFALMACAVIFVNAEDAGEGEAP